jgi:hypothetical protein
MRRINKSPLLFPKGQVLSATDLDVFGYIAFLLVRIFRQSDEKFKHADFDPS